MDRRVSRDRRWTSNTDWTTSWMIKHLTRLTLISSSVTLAILNCMLSGWSFFTGNRYNKGSLIYKPTRIHLHGCTEVILQQCAVWIYSLTYLLSYDNTFDRTARFTYLVAFQKLLHYWSLVKVDRRLQLR